MPILQVRLRSLFNGMSKGSFLISLNLFSSSNAISGEWLTGIASQHLEFLRRGNATDFTDKTASD